MPVGSSVDAVGPRPRGPPSPCADDDLDADSRLTIAVSGLPGEIVAGSGWHPFALTASNHSDRPPGQVQWLALVDDESMSENEDEREREGLAEHLRAAGVPVPQARQPRRRPR
ncbi:hypothetical protein [Streptomyces sp. SAT1]|uniref:hypothetical protein n=1 Tax=Streptomyces sp. SAT1 TaxID=1849967 RepID=UPI001331ACFF|nr:hypothetical protein [Streptomyces sp. SAT1]